MTDSIDIFSERGRQEDQSRIAEEAANWFARLSDEEASEDDFAAYRVWRAASAGHAKAFDRAATVYAGIGQFGDSTSIVEMRLAALAQSNQRPESDRNRMRYATLAASLCMVFLLGVLVTAVNWKASENELGQQAQLVAQNDVASAQEAGTSTASAAEKPNPIERFRTNYSTRIGQIAEFTLPDGSVIELNTDSQIQVDFKEGRRDLTLVRGEAVFTVAKDASRPFAVKAGQSRVVAVGTIFTIRKTGSEARVTLIKGRVRIDQESASGRETSTQLAPGEQISLLNNRPSEISRTKIEQVASWRDGRLIFEQTPLSEVLQEFNRYSTEQHVLRDESIANLMVSGTFRIKSSEYFAATLEAGFPVVVRARSNGAILEVLAADDTSLNPDQLSR